MKFKETKLKGAFVIELEKHEDERGFFARSWCMKEFEEHGLNTNIVQCNISYNKKKGTVRGMHFQKSPYEEAKTVSCIKGSVYDVIVDLRKESPTYMEWYAVELSTANFKMLYVPERFAHGFQTLTDDTLVYYQMSGFFYPESSGGILWDSKSLNIKWPIDTDITVSQKDREFPDMGIEL